MGRLPIMIFFLFLF